MAVFLHGIFISWSLRDVCLVNVLNELKKLSFGHLLFMSVIIVINLGIVSFFYRKQSKMRNEGKRNTKVKFTETKVRLLIVILTAFTLLFALKLNKQYIEDSDLRSILLSIATALSAILAIVFAFSQIILSNISEKYSPHILEKYRGDKRTYITFSLFIMTILFSIFSSLFLKIASSWFKFVIILVVIMLLSSCFYYFIRYFDYIFEVVNPLNFVDRLGHEAARNIELNNEDETRNSITSLGDISLKSLKRDEDEVVKKILDIELRIFMHYLEIKKREPEKYSLRSDGREKRNAAFIYLLNEQLRLFKNALWLKNDNITLEISDKLFDYIFFLLQGSNNFDLMKQILETKYVHETFFSEFLKEAINNESKSRYSFVRIFPDILQFNQLSDTKIRNDYMEDLILIHIFRINWIIIDHQDFDLFKSEIHEYSTRLIGLKPLDIKGEIESLLDFYNIPSSFFNDERETESFNQDSKKLRSFTRFRLHFCTECYQQFSELLNNFLDRAEENCDSIDIDLQLKNSPEEYKNWTDERIKEMKQNVKSKVSAFKAEKDNLIVKINKELHTLYISSILHQTFFGIGWYIVFCKSQIDLDAQRYLKELWEHTKPEDSRVRTVNEPPVSFNIEFNTQILLHGAGIWMIPFNFVGFHGASKYIYHYYLLLLTYSRVKFEKDLNILLSDIDTLFELEEKYKFIYWFISEGEERDNRVGNLITHIDELIEEAGDWNILMDFKEKNIDAKNAFTGTKEWIRKKVNEFKETKRQIEMRLPIDEEKVKKCREEILRSYKEASIIYKVVNQKEYNQKKDENLDIIQIDKKSPCPKSSLVRVSTVLTNWDNLGKSIANGEKNYLLKQVVGNKEIRRVIVKSREKKNVELLFSRVFETIKTLVEDGLNPSSIFIPFKYSAEILKKSHDSSSILNKKIRYENGEHLIYDENTKLEIFFSSEITPFDDIIILDKDFGVWTYKVDEKANERLFIDINEYEEDKSQVVLYARTVFSLEITDPERARILGLQ
jgi:hypothetical protein